MSPTLAVVPLSDKETRELSRAARQAQTWTERRNSLIRAAHGAGHGVREIARAVGLNHATVLNIIKPRRRKP
jgi:predicted transcriptional regulator